nr:MAG TPA: hypothetical protein [Caudoviricetes sp.]
MEKSFNAQFVPRELCQYSIAKSSTIFLLNLSIIKFMLLIFTSIAQ